MSKTKNPRIIARYGDKVVGWVGSEKKCRLYGDEEWILHATAASDVKLEFTLYNGKPFTADINDHTNPAGAFAALAWFAKERIDIREAPVGMMESMGLLETPEILSPLYNVENATEEEEAFADRHLCLIIDGNEQWLPLEQFTNPESLSKERILEILGK